MKLVIVLYGCMHCQKEKFYPLMHVCVCVCDGDRCILHWNLHKLWRLGDKRHRGERECHWIYELPYLSEPNLFLVYGFGDSIFIMGNFKLFQLWLWLRLDWRLYPKSLHFCPFIYLFLGLAPLALFMGYEQCIKTNE